MNYLLPSLSQIFSSLKESDYSIIGPTIENDVIIYSEISNESDLPIGWSDEQSGGHYSLKKENHSHFFEFTLPPNNLRRFLQPPQEKIWTALKENKEITLNSEKVESKKIAFIGIRACDLKALLIQDKIFIKGHKVDDRYQIRRKNIFIIAVDCYHVQPTCFCTSMESGPKANDGFDIALTEIPFDHTSQFLLRSGSPQGEEFLSHLHLKNAPSQVENLAFELYSKTVEKLSKNLGLQKNLVKNLLYQNQEHPVWEAITATCLACGNCTLVCPTCFCNLFFDTSDLRGVTSERWRKWDSCFNLDHSYLHGGSVRPSILSMYRQWITHKLATWIDQFESSGCVGCGRCITWCPVGIDIRKSIEELQKGVEK